MWSFSLPTPYDARPSQHIAPTTSGKHASAASRPEQLGPQSYATSTIPTQKPEESRWQTLWTSRRSRQQFSYFAAGASFMLLSAWVTRRALNRKLLSTKPSGLFSPSNHVKPAPGSLDALEALSLATLNVSSFGVMMIGGGLWAFDISNLEELRTKVRRGMDIDGKDKTDPEYEADMEEWMAVMLARLQGKNDKDIGEMLKEAAQIGQSRKS
ncbi:hypothetical protein K461DRAFT_295641 [Myriangium duriaei CBS 260.36]|uniref:Altered inheritance of mitochondria protein 11 n=1 Tax=Myriangium duriaei CBS 260.36 TaxID=1168546 RepID=A0A9P4IWX4_9PEZI|nr:hypothetical protein K461DRAFT_295641 [Myriangium duriaei CBS 260.36]